MITTAMSTGLAISLITGVKGCYAPPVRIDASIDAECLTWLHDARGCCLSLSCANDYVEYLRHVVEEAESHLDTEPCHIGSLSKHGNQEDDMVVDAFVRTHWKIPRGSGYKIIQESCKERLEPFPRRTKTLSRQCKTHSLDRSSLFRNVHIAPYILSCLAGTDRLTPRRVPLKRKPILYHRDHEDLKIT